ncbi:MAG: histidinol-phosphate transaminase [Nitrospirota bacterium]|jgi:histidinol-phosphate aminotransferase
MPFAAPEHIRRIAPYVPGKPVEELAREMGLSDIVKLASNENPLGPSPRAIDAARTAVTEIHRYPDGGGFEVTRALARHLDVEPAAIVLGNGSNELLDLVVRTFHRPGDTAITSANSFVVYPLAMGVVGSECRQVAMRDDTYDLDALIAAVDETTRFVFLANPNNPTGTAITRTSLIAFLDRLPEHCLCCLDEAYFEYRDPAADPVDGVALFSAGRRVAVFRTFSKAYGLAGLRIGYLVIDPALAADVHRVREPFNTNHVAQKAALAALEDTDHLARVVAENAAGRKWLGDALRNLGLAPPASQANFVYVDLGRPAAPVYEVMLKAGVIVRPVGPTQIRITVGTEAENRRCIDALEAALAAPAEV